MKRVAIWAAVSTLPQTKKISLEDQLEQGRMAAARHGAHVVAELAVRGESRSIILFEEACRRIDAYEQLKGLIETKAIDVLIYLDVSRLGRMAALVLTVAELCTRANILLYELDNPPASMEFEPPNYDALLMRAIKATGAQNEVRKMHDKHRSGMIGRTQQGLFPAKPNYGYKAVYNADGEFVEYVVDEPAITLVLYIIHLYMERGMGQRTIADHLNRLGYESIKRKALWEGNAVGSILSHAWQYAGIVEINRKSKTNRQYLRAPAAWPAIITEDQARQILAEMKRRSVSPRSVWRPYRFGSMCVCNVCGSIMASTTHHTKFQKRDGTVNRWGRRRYRCRGRHCAISEKKVYEALCKQIIILQDRAYRESIIATQTNTDTSSINDQIEIHQHHIEQLKTAIKKADNDYYIHNRLDGDRYDAIVASAKKSILTVQAEITLLQDKLYEASQVAQRGDRLRLIAETGLQHLDDPDVPAANAWLRQFFRILVDGNEVIAIEIL